VEITASIWVIDPEEEPMRNPRSAAATASPGDVLLLREARRDLELPAGYYVLAERHGSLVLIDRAVEVEPGGRLVALGEPEPVPMCVLEGMEMTGRHDSPRRAG
jgi:hypothetical protein